MNTKDSPLSSGIADATPIQNYLGINEISPLDGFTGFTWPSNLWKELDDMFSFWRARSNFLTSNKKLNKEPDIFGKQLANIGLRELIGRPHNLYAEHNENGKITKYVIKIVYTPFSKEDVHVSVKDNTLNIEIGKENLSPEKNCVYCGISRQRERISMYLSDRNVEFEKITAKCDDGILTIELPVNKSKSSRVIEIV